MLHETCNDKIKRTKSEDGKYIRRKHDERISRDGKNCRYRISCKRDIGALDHEQHKEEGCGVPFAVFQDKEFIVFVSLRDGEKFSREFDERVVFRVHFRFFLDEKFECRVDKKQSEQVENPVELRDERRAGNDEYRAEHDCAEHAPKQHFMLDVLWNGEVREDYDEHEHIVDGKRFLHHVPGEEFEHFFFALFVENENAEQESERNPDHRPCHSFPEGGEMHFALGNAEIKREHSENKQKEENENYVVAHKVP